MAELWDPEGSKTFRTKDGTQYAFIHKKACAGRPTFLLLHGFPSSSYDWRHQVRSLAAKGFGVLAPDLLGYGSTDSPDDYRSYDNKAMSAHMNEILDEEGIQKVIGVGHDWGSEMLSYFHGWHPQRLLGVVFMSVGYLEPSSSSIDVDAINAMTEKAIGYPCYGYIKFFDTEEAAALLNQHTQSIDSLFYPPTPELWKTEMGPLGAAEAWIKSNKVAERPNWLSAEEASTHNKIMSQKGYQGPLNWYKAGVRGVGLEAYEGWPDERKRIKIPTLFLGTELDPITRADMQKDALTTWAGDLTIELFQCGHWLQLEQPDKVTDSLVEFAKKFESGSSA